MSNTKSRIFSRYKKHKESSQPYVNAYGAEVMIFDMMYLMRSHFVANTAITEGGIPVGGVVGALNKVGELYSKYKPNSVVCVFDGGDNKKRRKKIFSEYKASRGTGSHLKTPFEMSATQVEKAEELQLLMLLYLTKLLPVKVLHYKELEADDIIGYLIKHHFGEDYKKIIVSADKDFHQLISENCLQYNPRQRKMFSKSVIENELRVLPENYIYVRLFEGDPSDDLKGVKGVARKTVLKYFPELLSESYDTLDDFLKLLDEKEIKLKKSKKGKDILASEEILRRNYELMYLDDHFVKPQEKMSIIDTMNNHQSDSLLLKNKFKSKIKELGIDTELKLNYINNLYTYLSA